MVDDTQQKEYNKRVEAQNIAFRYFSNKLNVAGESPLVRKYYDYYVSKQDYKIQKELEQLRNDQAAQMMTTREGVVPVSTQKPVSTQRPSLPNYLAGLRSTSPSAVFTQEPMSSKSISQIQQNVISGPTQQLTGVSPTSQKPSLTRYMESVRKPNAIVGLVQTAKENERIARELGLQFYQTKSPIQSGFSFLFPKGTYDLSYSQQIGNIETLKKVEQAKINVGRIEKSFKQNPLGFTGFGDVSGMTTREGEVISFKPSEEYLKNYFSFGDTFKKEAQKQFSQKSYYSKVPAYIAETEFSIAKTGLGISQGLLQYSQKFFSGGKYKVTDKGVSEIDALSKMLEITGGPQKTIMETPTSPYIQTAINLGTFAFLTSDTIGTSIQSYKQLGLQRSIVETGSKLSPIQFNPNPRFTIPQDLRAIEVYSGEKITRLYPTQKEQTLFGPTEFKGIETISKNVATGRFKFSYPETKFIGGEFVSTPTSVRLGGVVTGQPYYQGLTKLEGYSVVTKNVDNILRTDIEPFKAISGRRGFDKQFQIISGDYKEGFFSYRTSIRDLKITPGMNIDVKTRISGIKVYPKDLYKTYDISPSNLNYGTPSNLITGQLSTQTSLTNLGSFKSLGVKSPQSQLSSISALGISNAKSLGISGQLPKGLSYKTIQEPKQYSISKVSVTENISPITKSITVPRLSSVSSQLVSDVQKSFQSEKLIQVPRQQQQQKLKTGFEFAGFTGINTTGNFFGGFKGISGFMLPPIPKSLGFGLGKGFSMKGLSPKKSIKPSFTAVTLDLRGTLPSPKSIGGLDLGILPSQLRLIPLGGSGKKRKSKKSSKKKR